MYFWLYKLENDYDQKKKKKKKISRKLGNPISSWLVYYRSLTILSFFGKELHDATVIEQHDQDYVI